MQSYMMIRCVVKGWKNNKQIEIAFKITLQITVVTLVLALTSARLYLNYKETRINVNTFKCLDIPEVLR